MSKSSRVRVYIRTLSTPQKVGRSSRPFTILKNTLTLWNLVDNDITNIVYKNNFNNAITKEKYYIKIIPNEPKSVVLIRSKSIMNQM